MVQLIPGIIASVSGVEPTEIPLISTAAPAGSELMVSSSLASAGCSIVATGSTSACGVADFIDCGAATAVAAACKDADAGVTGASGGVEASDTIFVAG